MKLKVRLLAHVAFWVGVVLSYWDFFETCLEAGDTPYRVHHYYWGLLLTLFGYFILTGRDWMMSLSRALSWRPSIFTSLRKKKPMIY